MSREHSNGISRRKFLKGSLVAAGVAALARPRWLMPKVWAEPAAKPAAPATKARAKSVIQVWLWGGPCHLDTFDPKPDAGPEYCGQLAEPIATNVEGIRICQMLPLLAQQADKYSILRGMTHGINGHETAAYMVQTGRKPGGRIVYPCAGAVVSYFKGYRAGYKGLIPPYVVLTRPQGRFSEAGFLGGRYKPFATGGNPAQTPFAVEGVLDPTIGPQRQASRRELLGELNTLGRAVKGSAEMKTMDKTEKEAYDLILGEEGKVFDLTQESDELREQYGRTTFGQSCLAARRLVEHGVPYVTINYGGWDTHKQHFQQMRRLLPEMDKGFSTLLTDLSDRKMLDDTIVWWGGEFGRTPKVQNEAPWNGGRNHFGSAFCHVVAGGGFKGGHVVGATDDKGEKAVERPIWPWDLIASFYELLGIDSAAKLPHPQGLDVAVMEADSDDPKAAIHPLHEIM